jgi:hypothetical protein
MWPRICAIKTMLVGWLVMISAKCRSIYEGEKR